jgi:stalled ribosome alternative rescue factor ArfA
MAKYGCKKGKVKDIVSIAMIEDPLDVDSGEESTKEKGFYAF